MHAPPKRVRDSRNRTPKDPRRGGDLRRIHVARLSRRLRSAGRCPPNAQGVRPGWAPVLTLRYGASRNPAPRPGDRALPCLSGLIHTPHARIRTPRTAVKPHCTTASKVTDQRAIPPGVRPGSQGSVSESFRTADPYLSSSSLERSPVGSGISRRFGMEVYSNQSLTTSPRTRHPSD